MLLVLLLLVSLLLILVLLVLLLLVSLLASLLLALLLLVSLLLVGVERLEPVVSVEPVLLVSDRTLPIALVKIIDGWPYGLA